MPKNDNVIIFDANIRIKIQATLLISKFNTAVE